MKLGDKTISYNLKDIKGVIDVYTLIKDFDKVMIYIYLNDKLRYCFGIHNKNPFKYSTYVKLDLYNKTSKDYEYKQIGSISIHGDYLNSKWVVNEKYTKINHDKDFELTDIKADIFLTIIKYMYLNRSWKYSNKFPLKKNEITEKILSLSNSKTEKLIEEIDNNKCIDSNEPKIKKTTLCDSCKYRKDCVRSYTSFKECIEFEAGPAALDYRNFS